MSYGKGPNSGQCLSRHLSVCKANMLAGLHYQIGQSHGGDYVECFRILDLNIVCMVSKCPSYLSIDSFQGR